MYSYSYGINNVVLLICFSKVMVSLIGPYSCLFFSMLTSMFIEGLLFYVFDVFLISLFNTTTGLTDVRHFACVTHKFIDSPIVLFLYFWFCELL